MNSRDKGKRGELEWAHYLQGRGVETRRGQQFNGLEGEDVVSALPVHFEVKRVERLNVSEAMVQAARDAKDKIPVVAHRKNREEWLVTMRAEDWLKLLRGGAA